MAKNKTTRVLYLDTYNTDEQYTYNDYVEECEDNGVEPAEEGSHDHFEWLQRQRQYDIEDFWDNLKGCDFGECEVNGTLGLWWGNPDIETMRIATLYDAVAACANNAWDLIVYLEKGILYVDAMHHDGTNSFMIKPMIKGKRFPKYLW